MPKWLKVVLLVFGVLVLLCGLGVGGVTWWFNQNKDRLVEEGKRVTAEGTAFGGTSTSEGCITEGLRRLDSASGFMGEVEAGLFLEACLTAAPRDTLCTGVPKKTDFLKAALWASEQCASRKHERDQACGRLMQRVADFCAKPAVAK